MSDFSDRPFHVGSLVGLRTFGVDALGRLTGPSYGGIFKPGENEAECKADPMAATLASVLARQNTYMEELYKSIYAAERPRKRRKKDDPPLAEAAVETREAVKPQHTLAGMGCKCGFYAYFDGMNDYLQAGRVAALIEGYGVYTIGTRGFRASKARLVALVVPEMGKTETYSLGGHLGSFTVPTPRAGESMTPMLWEYVQRNYPGVPIFLTANDATVEHPLYRPETPTPETADDFWTRSA